MSPSLANLCYRQRGQPSPPHSHLCLISYPGFIPYGRNEASPLAPACGDEQLGTGCLWGFSLPAASCSPSQPNTSNTAANTAALTYTMNITMGRSRRQRHKQVVWGGSILLAWAAPCYRVSCYGVLGHCRSQPTYQQLHQCPAAGPASWKRVTVLRTVCYPIYNDACEQRARLTLPPARRAFPSMSLGYWGTTSGTGAMPSTRCSSENIASRSSTGCSSSFSMRHISVLQWSWVWQQSWAAVGKVPVLFWDPPSRNHFKAPNTRLCW